MMALMVPIALCLILNIALIAAQEACRQAQECIGQTITAGFLEAYGYKAVFGGSIQNAAVSTNANFNNCFGSYSCAQMSSIATQGSIGCRGSHACANVGSEIDEITGQRNGITCSGQYACENSKITSLTQIDCQADFSCKNTNMAAPIINAQGAYSMYESTIDTNNIAGNVLDLYLTGYQAGFGGNVICRTGDTCNVYCYSNGCQMLNVECEDGSNCNIELNTANDPTITVPPIQDTNNFNAGLADIKYNYPNTDQLCESSSFVYDAYVQFDGQGPKDIESNGGPVCCRGQQACSNYESSQVENIRYTDTPDFTICSAHGACKATTITNTKSVFCEAYGACGGATMDITDAPSSDVYCTGIFGCNHAEISGATNVYCSGWRSCMDTTMRSDGNSLNVYLLGTRSGEDMHIYCDDGDECIIFCVGAESCNDITVSTYPSTTFTSTVNCINNNCVVYCNTQDTGCPDGVADNWPPPPTDPCANADCADNLVCESGACQRDCSAFQIDEFLVDCSDKYQDNTVYITTLQDEVVAVNARLNSDGDVDQRLVSIENNIISTNDRLEIGGDVYNSIAATNARLDDGGDVYVQLSDIETSINDVDTTINARLNPGGDVNDLIVVTNDRLNDGGDIDGRLDTINARLDDGGDIDVRLDAIQARLDEGGDVEARLDSIEDAIAANTDQLGRYSAQSAGLVANVINDGEGGSSSNVWFSAESKDALIVFLLLLNTITTIGVCIVCILWSKSKAKYGKYSDVTVYSSADDERQQLQSLNN